MTNTIQNKLGEVNRERKYIMGLLAQLRIRLQNEKCDELYRLRSEYRKRLDKLTIKKHILESKLTKRNIQKN